MGKNFYAVKNGRMTGIFLTWDDCKAQIDGFPNAIFKGFQTKDEAIAYLGLAGSAGIKLEEKPKTNKPKQARVPSSTINKEDTTVIDETKIVIYTDGSCLKNPNGPGGHAAIIKLGEKMKEIVGAEASTTNNRMEMKATIEALKTFPIPVSAVVYTDSKYLCNGFAKGWVANWKRTGWITSTQTPVLNQDLWMELDRLTSIHKVMWKWVKGHNGNPLNERCDKLAVEAAIAKAKEIGWKGSLPNR